MKDQLRPIKHALFGISDIYYVIQQVREARGQQAPVSMVLDVGSADGDKALVFLEAFPEAKVLCVEPNRAKHERFYRRVQQWNGQVELCGVGLYNTSGEMPLSIYSYADASSLLPIPPYLERQGKAVTGVAPIRVQRLDDVLRERGITHVDFMKVDVEGVEWEVLDGARESLALIDNLFVEISPLRKGLRSRDHILIFQLLYDAGFTFMGVYGDFWFTKDRHVLAAMQ